MARLLRVLRQLDKRPIITDKCPKAAIMDLEQKLDKEVSALFSTTPTAGGTVVRGRRKKLTFDEMLSNKMLTVAAIRRGVPYSLFDAIRRVAPLSESDWTEILDLSAKSLHRYRDAGKDFRPLQSEKIIATAEVAKRGLEVFGERERFRLWLDTPNFALGNAKPIELLRDSYGKALVMGELVRIEHGVLA